MAYTDTTIFPVKGQAFRIHFVIRSFLTGNPLLGALASLAAQVSKDGGSFVTTTNSPVLIDTSGYGYVDLTAAEMNAQGIVLRVSTTTTNAVEFCAELRPADLTETTGHWKDQSVQRLEQSLVLLSAFLTNLHTLTMSSEAIKARDNSTTIVSGSVTGLTDGGATVTRTKMI